MEYKELENMVLELQERVATLEQEKEVYQNKHVIRKDITVMGDVYANRVYRKSGANYVQLTT